MSLSRFRQVLYYGWKHSGQIATDSRKNRIILFLDILYCFVQYKMWSNQYLKERFWDLSSDKRKSVGKGYRAKGIKRDEWQRDFQQTRKFLIRYSSIKYEAVGKRDIRRKAYTHRFNAGKGLRVEYDVNLSRQHYLNGSISMGDNVLLAKHVFIDYSGNVSIGNDVEITNGVIIETHFHPHHSDYNEPTDKVTATELRIDDGVLIGSRAIIMPSCHHIGRYARIGAGAVVTKDVPDYAVVVGIPAKIIRYQNRESDNLSSHFILK